jgi:YggT family protein
VRETGAGPLVRPIPLPVWQRPGKPSLPATLLSARVFASMSFAGMPFTGMFLHRHVLDRHLHHQHVRAGLPEFLCALFSTSFSYVIIIVAILSWLVAFNVINIYNEFVRSIWNALNALTEPLLRPIRQMLPNMGGIDISPIVLILLIYLIQDIITRYIYPYVI